MILSIEIAPSAIDLMKKLRRNTGVSSSAALLNDAITLMAWAVKQRQKGRIVASLDEASNTYKELQMTSLEHAADVVEGLDAAAASPDEEGQKRPELVVPQRLARAGGG